MPLLDRYNFTFLIEDPATVWNLGPERYREIAGKYAKLTPRTGNLAIDVNIVERYQDVYPTKQQTGGELFELVSTSARVFPRVALYFEHSLLPPDLPWLASAAAAVESVERTATGLLVASPRGAGIPWTGPAVVDGRLWVVSNGDTVWLPAGRHTIEPAPESPHTRLVDFTGDLTGAAATQSGVEFAYRSSARALAVLDRQPVKVELDGGPWKARSLVSGDRYVLLLPRGQHVVTVETD
jgi:hypothetical protein